MNVELKWKCSMYLVLCMSISDLLGIFNILGSSCNTAPVGFVATKWKCWQFDGTICILSWVRALSFISYSFNIYVDLFGRFIPWTFFFMMIVSWLSSEILGNLLVVLCWKCHTFYLRIAKVKSLLSNVFPLLNMYTVVIIW
jgi:uncharacterized integral membrane protein